MPTSTSTPTKHTPGPWSIARRGSGGCRVESRDGLHVAGVSDGFFDDEAKEFEANARLIAAAPVMLDALRELAGVTENALAGDYCELATIEALAEAHEIIHRATGGAA
jgi:hypothetical protein